MGLFSSKSRSSSKTTTNYTDNSKDTTNATEFGSLSHDNLSIGANANYTSNYTYNEQGLTGENLDRVLGTVESLNGDILGTAESLYNKAQSVLSQTFDSSVSSVQKTAEKAIETTAQAYAESDDELRRTIDGLRPIAMYAMIAAVFYFIFRNKKW